MTVTKGVTLAHRLIRPMVGISNRVFPYSNISCVQLNHYQKRYHQMLIQKHQPSGELHEKNREKAIACEDVTKTGVFVNIGLVILKGSAGLLTNSMALMADAIHSLTDLFSDLMTYFTIRYSQRKPTKHFPLGFGKIDTFGTIPIAGLLMLGSYHIVKTSVSKLFILGAPAAMITMPYVAMGCVLLSLLVKEWLYRITIKAGNEYQSNVTIANAWHHRSDAISSLIALIGVGGYCIGFPVLDPICGMCVGFYLFKIGIDFFKIGFEQLLDRNSEMHYDDVNNILCKCDGVKGVHHLMVTPSGQYIHVTAEIMVNPVLKMKDVQLIVNNIKDKLHDDHSLNIQYLAIIPIPYHVHDREDCH
eukprot:29017_1